MVTQKNKTKYLPKKADMCQTPNKRIIGKKRRLRQKWNVTARNNNMYIFTLMRYFLHKFSIFHPLTPRNNKHIIVAPPEGTKACRGDTGMPFACSRCRGH